MTDFMTVQCSGTKGFYSCPGDAMALSSFALPRQALDQCQNKKGGKSSDATLGWIRSSFCWLMPMDCTFDVGWGHTRRETIWTFICWHWMCREFPVGGREEGNVFMTLQLFDCELESLNAAKHEAQHLVWLVWTEWNSTLGRTGREGAEALQSRNKLSILSVY